MQQYLSHGKITATRGNGDTLQAILFEAAELAGSLPTCSLYVVSRDEHNPEEIWVTEIWDSKDAHDASLQLPEAQSLINRAISYIAEPPSRGQELTITGRTGLAH